MSERKTALITGSSSGIGLAIAGVLAEEGYNIVLNSIQNPGSCTKQIAELAKYAAGTPEFVHYVQADVANAEEVEKMVAEAVRKFGSLDVIVNNAGIQHVASVEDFPLDKWQAIINLNLSSAFYVSKFALPHLKKSGWGRVINIASAHGLVASPFKSAYVAAKHGVVGFTKSLALECAEKNITVNAICPGYVLTSLVEQQIKEQAIAHNMPEDRVIRNSLKQRILGKWSHFCVQMLLKQ